MKFLIYLGLFVLSVAGLTAWGVAAASNYAHALQIAAESPWAPILAAASASADVLKAACVIAIIAALRRRLIIPVLACCLIWTATTVWSVRCGLGFISTTLSDSFAIRDSGEKAAKSNSEQLRDEQAYLRLLMRTEVKRASERVSLRDEIMQQRRKLDDVRTKVAGNKVGEGDPVGKLLKDHLGIDEGKTSLWTALAFLALIELCSNLGLAAFAHLFPSPRFDSEVEAASDDEDKPLVEDRAKPHLVVDNDPPQPKPVEIQPPAVALVAAARPGRRRDELGPFVSDIIARYGSGNRVVTSAIQADYRDWCVKHSIYPPMTDWHLGKALAVYGFVRTKTKDARGRYHYMLPTKAAAA